MTNTMMRANTAIHAEVISINSTNLASIIKKEAIINEIKRSVASLPLKISVFFNNAKTTTKTKRNAKIGKKYVNADTAAMSILSGPLRLRNPIDKTYNTSQNNNRPKIFFNPPHTKSRTPIAPPILPIIKGPDNHATC